METTTPAAVVNNEQLISVYPVPAHDQVTIAIPDNRQKSQIIVSDINGKVYAVATATGNIHTLNISKYPAGMYMVQIINGDKKTIKKILKK
jgi:endoglucanase